MNSLTQGISIVVYDFSALKGKLALKHDTILMQRKYTHLWSIPDFEVHYMQNTIGNQEGTSLHDMETE